MEAQIGVATVEDPETSWDLGVEQRNLAAKRTGLAYRSAEERQGTQEVHHRQRENMGSNVGRECRHLGHRCGVKQHTDRTDTGSRESSQHTRLTLVPVVVSALVSAPRRSNTDVLWRPGREVAP